MCETKIKFVMDYTKIVELLYILLCFNAVSAHSFHINILYIVVNTKKKGKGTLIQQIFKPPQMVYLLID